LLGLTELGRALSDAASALGSPFVLARDVFDLRRHELGALLGSIPLATAFATRQLNLSPNRVNDQRRALARAALLDARVGALRVLLRELLLSGPAAARRELAELSHAALGFELPLTALGALIRVRPRDSQRFAGALLAASRQQALVEVHDEDWFRNPRAVRELRAGLSEPRPSELDTEALSAGKHAFRARIEALL
jgi:hypothetical protein